MWKASVSYQPDKIDIRVGVLTLTYEYDDGRPPFVFVSEPSNFGVIKDMDSLAAAKQARDLGADVVEVEHQDFDPQDMERYQTSMMAATSPEAKVLIVPPMKMKNELPVSDDLFGFDHDVLQAIKDAAETARVKYEAGQTVVVAVDEQAINDFMNDGKAPSGIKLSTVTAGKVGA
jgi:hypothetical protein